MPLDARHTATIGLALIAVVSLIGCSASPTPHQSQGGMPAPVAPKTSAVASPTPTPTPTLLPGTDGSVSLTDKDGYTFEVKYSFRFGPDFASEVAEEKPGFTRLVSNSTSSLEIRNTTPGRDYLSGGIYQLALLYPMSTTMCSTRVYSTQNTLSFLTVRSADNTETDYCGIRAFNAGTRGLTLTANEMSGNLAANVQELGLSGVPEVLASEIGIELQAPAYYVLILTEGAFSHTVQTACELSGDVNLSGVVIESQPTLPGC